MSNLLEEISKIEPRLRIAFNEADDSECYEREAAHFLKIDERRVGRDIELYGFMAKLEGKGAVTATVLEELVFPIKGISTEAFNKALEILDSTEFTTAFADQATKKEWSSIISSMKI